MTGNPIVDRRQERIGRSRDDRARLDRLDRALGIPRFPQAGQDERGAPVIRTACGTLRLAPGSPAIRR